MSSLTAKQILEAKELLKKEYLEEQARADKCGLEIQKVLDKYGMVISLQSNPTMLITSKTLADKTSNSV